MDDRETQKPEDSASSRDVSESQRTATDSTPAPDITPQAVKTWFLEEMGKFINIISPEHREKFQKKVQWTADWIWKMEYLASELKTADARKKKIIARKFLRKMLNEMPELGLYDISQFGVIVTIIKRDGDKGAIYPKRIRELFEKEIYKATNSLEIGREVIRVLFEHLGWGVDIWEITREISDLFVGGVFKDGVQRAKRKLKNLDAPFVISELYSGNIRLDPTLDWLVETEEAQGEEKENIPQQQENHTILELQEVAAGLRKELTAALKEAERVPTLERQMAELQIRLEAVLKMHEAASKKDKNGSTDASDDASESGRDEKGRAEIHTHIRKELAMQQLMMHLRNRCNNPVTFRIFEAIARASENGISFKEIVSRTRVEDSKADMTQRLQSFERQNPDIFGERGIVQLTIDAVDGQTIFKIVPR